MIYTLEQTTTRAESTEIQYPQQLTRLVPGADVQIHMVGNLPSNQQMRPIWIFYQFAGENNQRVKLLQRVSSNQIDMLAGNSSKFIPTANGFIPGSNIDHLVYTPERKVIFPIFDKFLRGFGK